MTSPARCKHLWNICNELLKQNVPGSFVECGVWRGGSAGVLGLVLKRVGEQRKLHLFDSFEGLPEPTVDDGAYAAEYSGGRSGGALVSVNQCRSSLAEVQDFLIQELGLDTKMLQFHVGWFQDTVPRAADTVGPIAVLRLDGDWYESTKVCLEYLYHLVSPGGVVILDDFQFWQGCAKAANEFRSKFAITAPIQKIDADAVFWRVDDSAAKCLA